VRERQREAVKSRYDGTCARSGQDPAAAAAGVGAGAAFPQSAERCGGMDDAVKGRIEISNEELDDP